MKDEQEKNGQILMASMLFGIVFTLFFTKDIFEYLFPNPTISGDMVLFLFAIPVFAIFSGFFLTLFFIISMKKR